MTSAGNRPSRDSPALQEVWTNPAAVLARRSHAVDAAVREVFARRLLPAVPGGLALVAVGGFGREQLFPHSDVDLLLLVESGNLPERKRDAISGFVQSLWDHGLTVSQSVHTPAECCEFQERNIELSVSLLDQRYLAGDRGLYAKLSLGLARFFHGQRLTLARRLCRMGRERHARQGGSIYQLEPNVKEVPGGLRDYQLGGWLGQLRKTGPDRLARPEPPAALLPARDFLFALRCWLHLNTARDMNLLTFDLQEEIAAGLGAGPASWMRQYYSHAREIHLAVLREMEAAEEQVSSLLVQFRDWRSRVANAGFSVSRERVYFRAPQRLEYEPLLALALFQFVARHGVRLAPEAGRHLAGELPRLRRFFSQSRPALWPILKDMLSARHRALALRAMHETGVLAALFPEWAGIDCLVIRDFYHRYTVDEHTLVAIQILDDLASGAAPAHRHFAELLSETGEPELLVFALLFHDTGKGATPGPHVSESVRLAESAMERIWMPAAERRTVRLLIDRHLDLSIAMSGRDLDDPGTARYLAGRAGTLEALKKLVLVTYADIGAVNPTAMSSWRMTQLWRAYLAVSYELTRELEQDRLAPAAERPEFLEGFPVRYLRTHSQAEIGAHLELERRSRDRGVALEIQKEDGYYRLTLVTRDRPFLLASLAGALSGFGMNILKAEGFSNRRNTILDTFSFSDPHRTLELNPQEMDRLRMVLERVALGKTDVKALLGGRPRPAPPSGGSRIRPSVSFDNAASDSATLVEIVAEDRPALLYDLASAISSAGANIELVLIDTQAHKALDVFYVTASGAKLTAGQQSALKHALYRACQG